MKKKYLILISIFLLFIAGCSNNENTANNNQNTLNIDQNTISEGTSSNLNKNDSVLNTFNENLNQMSFNSNLTDYEQKYLTYYKDKYPLSKIYYMKTNIYKCIGCYDIYYKKDREILMIKIRDNNISQETIIKSEQELYIENPSMCKLFQGTWNICPKICPTDEEICATECGPAKCEFDINKIVYKKLNEICGGFNEGDCEYGLICTYKSQEDELGVCKQK